ncbi:Transcriptional activator protein CzcR [Usitatibacter rugosus]|uniref:Transcriptional activator protein CzcR n=1 Tax=Usitatibacter rugosus TaxID=2732067 RepID=A0A6M4GUU9_9PROT|nr:response regulator [Usitatibacter rugosus]QJR10648.1 Transcriptional activator protein CzcR [Usitatibacter rugosus]
MRILHLDDDPLQLDIARIWLEGAGHVVTSCESGAAAMQAFEEGVFDVVVLDSMLPDIPGEEVLRWMRRTGNRVPTLFATASDTEEDLARIRALGADGLLVKPLRRETFLARVESVSRL